MASFLVSLSKPQLLKRIFSNNFLKPSYHFSSSANEHKPDPNPHHLTHESQPNPSKTDHYKQVEALCKDQRFNDAKQFIYRLAQKGIHKNEDLFILLINAYANTTKRYDAYQNSVRIFKTMGKLGVSKTAKSYNHLFDVCFSARMSARASMFFDKMLEERVDPDMDTYRIMILGLCRCYDVDSANEPFQHMKSRKISPDIVIYNNMIHGYVRFKEMDEAEKIIAEMKGGHVKPDLDSYNLLIHGYAQVRKMEDVERLVVDMKERGIEPNLVTYVTMIKGYVKAERVDNGLDLLEEMKGKRIGENVDVLTSLGQLTEDCDAENMWASLGRLRKDLDAENMSETQQSVLQGVKDYIKRLELLTKHAATELSGLASSQVAGNMITDV